MEKNEFFPLCDQEGTPVTLNTELMHTMSANSEPISNAQLQIIIEEHKLFIVNGGKGGAWQTFEAAGLTLAVYHGVKATRGKQASFLNSNLTEIDLSEINLEYADFVNIYYPNGTFRNSDLKNSIFVDSVLNDCDFSGADLSGCDFSRAEMNNCKFSGTNLSGCDFENCNFTGSDFSGANTSGSRFPGAKLDNVVF